MKLAIIDIPGIGPAAAKTLAEHRIGSLVDFAKASVEEVSAVPGFSEARATRGIAAAVELPTESGITQPTKGKGKGKGKGKKKGKN